MHVLCYRALVHRASRGSGLASFFSPEGQRGEDIENVNFFLISLKVEGQAGWARYFTGGGPHMATPLSHSHP